MRVGFGQMKLNLWGVWGTNTSRNFSEKGPLSSV
jgi:hypothetical protein